MFRHKLIKFAVYSLCFISLSANADTQDLDDIAACAGVVIGNGAVDFYMGNEQSFDVAADIAYSAYLSEVFQGKWSENDLRVADQILGGNVDKIINAYNTDSFDNEVYEEIVGCYRSLSVQLLRRAKTIMNEKNNWSDVKTNSIMNLKRMLRAG